MKNIFNSRPLWIAIISLIFSIVVVCSNIFFDTLVSKLFVVLMIVIVVALIVFLVIKLIKKNNNGVISIVCAIIFMICGAISSVVVLNQKDYSFGNNVIVYGRVGDVDSYSKLDCIILEDLIIDDVSVSGKLELKCFGVASVDISVGDIVTTSGDIIKTEVSYDNLYYLLDNINYSMSCTISDIEVVGSSYNFRAAISNKIKDNLDSIMNETNSAIAYSTLFGEKDGMPTEVYNIFSYAGIAHILAVSGLHIGFLVSVILLILKLLKCNRAIKNTILFVILILYAYLCDFTPSVSRAVIMAIVLTLSKSYRKEYDSLNSLSLAGIIILLCNPLNLFMAGFQLSFISVFSIITLSKPIRNVLDSVKCPSKLAETIAMSMAVNIGLLCVSAQHFNQINFISVISNIFVIPIFSICFSIMFLLSFLGLLIPAINYLLMIPNVLLHFIKLIANMFAQINILSFDLLKFSYIFVGLSILCTYLIHYAIIPKNYKRILCGTILMIIVVSAIVVNLPKTFNDDCAITGQTLDGNYVLVTTNNDFRCLVINGVSSQNEIVDMLNKNNISYIDSVVVNNYNFNQKELIEYISAKYNVEDLYITSRYSLCDDVGGSMKIHYEDSQFLVGNIEFEMLSGFSQNNFGLKIVYGDSDMLLLNTNAKAKELDNYFALNTDFDIVISTNYTKSISDYDIDIDTLVNNQTIQNLQGKNLFDLT